MGKCVGGEMLGGDISECLNIVRKGFYFIFFKMIVPLKFQPAKYKHNIYSTSFSKVHIVLKIIFLILANLRSLN